MNRQIHKLKNSAKISIKWRAEDKLKRLINNLKYAEGLISIDELRKQFKTSDTEMFDIDLSNKLIENQKNVVALAVD